MSAHAFDVLVIGGGITGVAIARECAQRGMKTVVVEQNDFSSGTTSRSSRVIHGGLRRLEHGEIVLAHECLRDQQKMLAATPRLVKPIHFLLAFPRNTLMPHRSFLAFRAGLFLYQLWNRGQRQDEDKLQAFQMQLDAGQSWSVFSYEDAQCEFPERMVAEWLLEAEAAGALACNYTQVLKVTRSSGRVSGAHLRDTLTGEEFTVSAPWVINATGAWADRVISESNISAEPTVEGVRGSHILLPAFPGAPDHAVRAKSVDGRDTMVIPWNGQVVVGATRAPDSGDPAEAAPDHWELEYLMNSFTRLFPASGLTKADVRGCYAGIWGAPRGEAKKGAEFGSRHVLHDCSEAGAIGLISVAGGSLSSAARVARDVARRMGLAMATPAIAYALSPGNGAAETALEHQAQIVAFKGRLTKSSASHLTEWYGRKALVVAEIAALDERLRDPICSHTNHLLAEAVYAVQQEHAVTLADIVLRRVPVALGSWWSEACSREAAIKIGSILGWDEQRIAMESENLEQEREKFLHSRPASMAQGSTTAAEAA